MEKQTQHINLKKSQCKRLEEERVKDITRVYSTIPGSSKFQVIVFKPGEKLRASQRLCICDMCRVDYGMCALFSEYELQVKFLKKTCLCSGFESNLGIDVDEESEGSEDIAHEKLTTGILVPGTIVALAAEKKSVDTFYLIKITME